MKLLSRVESIVDKYNLLNSEDKIVIGVSGGSDSIALVHILVQLQQQYKLELHIAHLDHQLRGAESRADAEFVACYANSLDIPITIKKADVKKYQREHSLSLEDAARQVRYEFFANLLSELDFNKLALGHHANDQAETVMMKLLRGAGLKGLGGIRPRNQEIIRPLIEEKKEQVKKYCIENDLEWRTDKTNQQEICLRNKIRLKLLPQLIEEYNENLINNLNQMAEVFRGEDEFLRVKTKEILSGIIIDNSEGRLVISKEEFSNLKLAIQRRIIRLLFKKLTGDYRNLYYHNIQEVLRLIQKDKTGIKTNLPEGVLVRINYGQIIFMMAQDETEIKSFSCRIKAGSQVEILELDMMINSKVLEQDYPWKKELSNQDRAFFDLDQVGKEFYIRQRKKGDCFQPLGMSGTKKVKDFFIDEKIPINRRDKIAMFTTKQGNIFWVGRLRIDDNYKITNKTEKILMIEVNDLKED